MKLLVIGPRQSGQLGSAAGEERVAMQRAEVEAYVTLVPRPDESRLAAAFRMWRESKTEEFDAVSTQDPFWSGLLAWCIARRAHVRFNVQVHADLQAQSWLRRQLARFVLRHADSIRAVSHRVQKQIIEYKIKAAVSVLPIFIDVSRFSVIERKPERMVLWMGRFEPEKDPLRALEIAKHAPDVLLVMLGSGSMEHRLREAAKGYNVQFPGWRDPREYLARAGVVLSTSPAESFGASVVEALAAGVPVVSLDTGVAREAGARVVPIEQLKDAVFETLDAQPPAELKLTLLSRDEWARAWRATL